MNSVASTIRDHSVVDHFRIELVACSVLILNVMKIALAAKINAVGTSKAKVLMFLNC